MSRFARTATVVALVLSAAGRRADSQPPFAAGTVEALRWRSIGPAIPSGRVTDLAVSIVAGKPDALFVATASGGLFRSANQATSWEPVLDQIDGLLSVGAVAVAPSDPNVVWVGTGEANNRQSSSWGEGVYKSNDGGRTWKHMGLRDSRHVGRIVIHPTNPDIVYVAALGHLWGPNAERGVFMTTDGGVTWKKVLYVGDDAGAVDLAMEPDDPSTLFAAIYQRQRAAWGMSGGGPRSGLYRSTDGGSTWGELTNGLPRGDKGRIGLDIYRRDGAIIYAIVEADPRTTPTGLSYVPPAPGERTKGGVFRSLDRGSTWEQVNNLNPRPNYFSQIRIDPNDSNRIYVLGESFHVSADGGRTFSMPRYGGDVIHPDHHALWIDPRDSRHLVLGNDGGLAISWDRGLTWRVVDNLPLGQFYHIGADLRDPYHVCGGLQDNGSWCVPSATRSTQGIMNRDVYNVGGSDGFNVWIDRGNHPKMFVADWGGRITRFDPTAGEGQAITPAPPRQRRGEDSVYRWNWDAPVVVSRFDAATLYAGRQALLKSTDRGQTWSVISPDLTARINRDTLTIMGKRVTNETLAANDGVSHYGAISAISESPLDKRVLYSGSDDGQLHVTRDGGVTWLNVTGRVLQLPARTHVSTVLASQHVASRVYATFDGHFNDDYKPYVYVSDDYGQSWKSLAGNLPETSVRVIAEDPRNPQLLFVGHEKGVHLSIDGGLSWESLNKHIPSVPVNALIVHPRENDLIAGTHGRGIWILDDISPLERLTPDIRDARAHLFAPRPARLWILKRPEVFQGSAAFVAANPPLGALITYYLRDKSPEARVSIRDSVGRTLRVIDGPTARGLNRVVWDLRIEPPYKPAGQTATTPQGPRVLPGTYRAMLSVGGMLAGEGGRATAEAGRDYEVAVVVQPDPVVNITAPDRRARHVARMQVYELQRTLRAALNAASSVAEALERMVAELPSRDSTAAKREPYQRAATISRRSGELRAALGAQLSSIEGSSIVGLPGLVEFLESYSGAPTPPQLQQIGWAFEDATRVVEQLNRLLSTEVPALYRDVNAKGTWPKLPAEIPVPKRRAPERGGA